MKISRLALAASALIGALCIQGVFATEAAKSSKGKKPASTATETSANGPSSPKHESFRLAMKEMRKFDAKYYDSGDFYHSKAASYAPLFDKKFNHKRTGRVIGYLMDAKEEALATEIAQMWIQKRGWKRFNRKLIKSDLLMLAEGLHKQPEMYLKTFKLLVGLAKTEIAIEDSWTKVAAELLHLEAKIEGKSQEERIVTVNFLIHHFFRCADAESQSLLSERVFKQLSKSLDAQDFTLYEPILKEKLQALHPQQKLLFASSKSSLIGDETSSESVDSSSSAYSSEDSATETETQTNSVPLKKKNGSKPTANASNTNSRSTKAQSTKFEATKPTSILKTKSDSTLLWIICIASSGILIIFLATYLIVRRK